MTWCEACRDHYDIGHYDEDGIHGIGPEYGWVGKEIQQREVREAALKEIVRLTGVSGVTGWQIVDQIAKVAQEALDA